MYKPSVLFAYKQYRSDLPIDTWVEIIGKKLPNFQTNDDIYAPVPITLKLAGNISTPNGSIKLAISATDPNWYNDLINVVSGMVNNRKIDIVNMLGESIENLSTRDLFRVGECDVVDKTTKKVIRLDKIVEPPVKMSNNKIAALKKWWEDNADNLSKKVAMQFKNLNMAEIDKACIVDGPIQKTIESYISSNTLNNTSWKQFLENYGNNRTTIQDISKKVLDAVRQSLRANEQEVINFHASLGVGASVWSTKSGIKSDYTDSFQLYLNLVEDAVYHPAVQQEVIKGIMYGTRQKESIVDPISNNIEQSDFHPLQSYYQNHHYQVHGKLPGHLIAAYNKNQGRFDNNYPADAFETIAMFNLFTGRAIHPDMIAGSGGGGKGGGGKGGGKGFGGKGGKIKPKFKKGKKGKKTTKKATNLLSNTFNALQEAKRRRDQKKAEKARQARQAQQQDVNTQIPHLITIDMEEHIGEGMPTLVPYDPIKLPTLVPLYEEKVGERVAKLIPIDTKISIPKTKAKLVEMDFDDFIGSDIPSNNELSEPLWKQRLPSIADLLLKEKSNKNFY